MNNFSMLTKSITQSFNFSPAFLFYFPIDTFLSTSNEAIYKTRNTGTRNGVWVMREREECSLGFRGMLKKILGNVEEDSG